MFDLTIAIPTFNRAASLEKLLTNIAAQAGAEEIEVVVSDNGSTDDTKKVIERFRERLSITATGFEINQGFDRNYLNCAMAAHGAYLWIMGDDDALVPGAITRVLADVRKVRAEVLIYNGGDFRDGVLTPRVKYDPGHLPDVRSAMDSLGWLVCWIGTTVVRRKMIQPALLVAEDSNAFVHIPLLVRSFSGNSSVEFSQEVLIHTTVNNSEYFKNPIALVRTFGMQLYQTLARLSADGLLQSASVSKTVRGFYRHLGMFGVRDMLGWKRNALLGPLDFFKNRKYFLRVNPNVLFAGLVLLVPTDVINLLRNLKKRLAAPGDHS